MAGKGKSKNRHAAIIPTIIKVVIAAVVTANTQVSQQAQRTTLFVCQSM